MSPPATTTTTTRWCPTSEQLMILEEMYRGGMRTPGAALIQKITAHLSRYGRVEGKNVFYWFQNHKARDRQRLRRKISKQIMHHQHQHQHFFNGHQLLQYLGSLPPPPPPTAAPASPLLPLPHLYDPSSFLPHPHPHPQVSSVEEAYSSQVKNNTNKHVEASYGEGRGDRTVEMRRYKQKQADLMMTTIVEMPCSGPAKTLELFPLTATNLKEECKSQ